MLTGTASAGRLPMWATGQARIATSTSTLPAVAQPDQCRGDQGEGQREEQPERLDQVRRARLVDELGVAERHVDRLEAVGGVADHPDEPGEQDPRPRAWSRGAARRRPAGRRSRRRWRRARAAPHRWRRPIRGRRRSCRRRGRAAARPAARRSAAGRSVWSASVSVSDGRGGGGHGVSCRWRRPPPSGVPSAPPAHGENPGTENAGKTLDRAGTRPCHDERVTGRTPGDCAGWCRSCWSASSS